MKKTLSLLALAGLLSSTLAHSAGTAQARMYCLSLRFQQSHDDNDFFRLNFSSFSPGINGELGPYFYFFDPNTTHSAYLEVDDTLFDDVYSGAIDLNVPSGGDANGNGYSDFFEVSQDAGGSSTGTYSISGIGSGQVTASWSRSAGSSSGTCVLTLKNSSFGNLVFVASFEVMEYAGPLSYAPGTSAVSGSADLTQTGNPANTLEGPITFLKSAANSFNTLFLQSDSWTNVSAQVLTFPTNTFSRDLTRMTNYSGYVLFDDGDPNTAQADYWVWRLSIDDMNDTDHDGIPDFSDDPATTLPRKPVLALLKGTTNLWLQISGDTGHAHQIFENTNLASTNWQSVFSVTLTNDPQLVSLPLPGEKAKFWRVIAQ